MVLDGLLTAVGGFTGFGTTASMEVLDVKLDGGVWLHRPDAGWLPHPRSALACAVLPISGMEEHLQKEDLSGLRQLEEGLFDMDLEDSEDSDTSEEEEEEWEMGEEEEDSLIEDSEEEEVEE